MRNIILIPFSLALLLNISSSIIKASSLFLDIKEMESHQYTSLRIQENSNKQDLIIKSLLAEDRLKDGNENATKRSRFEEVKNGNDNSKTSSPPLHLEVQIPSSLKKTRRSSLES